MCNRQIDLLCPRMASRALHSKNLFKSINEFVLEYRKFRIAL